MKGQISLHDILIAKKRISQFIFKTPFRYSSNFSQESETECYLKLENLQYTGSFKLRGALNAMLSLPNEFREKGIITASAGNHAQGIAFASQLTNILATIYVPENTPQTKIDAIKSYGVNLEIKGKIYDNAEAMAIQKSKKEDIPYISPYNHPDVIAGQGTIGLEIVDDQPEIDSLLIPLSGGGLFSGIAIAVKSINPEIKCYGVQLEACPVMKESLKAGKIVDVFMEDSIAEGLHGGVEKGSITFPYIQQYCEEVLLVREDEIKQSITDLISHHHLISEGAGAVGIAALKRYKRQFQDEKVGIIISGANLDIKELRKILTF